MGRGQGGERLAAAGRGSGSTTADGLFANVFGERRGLTNSIDYLAEAGHLSRHYQHPGWLHTRQPDFQPVLISKFNMIGNGRHRWVCLGFLEEGRGIGRGTGERQFAVVTLDRESLEDEMAVPIEVWGDDLAAAVADAARKFADGRVTDHDEGRNAVFDLDRGHVSEFSEAAFERGFRKLWTPPHRRANPEGELRVSASHLAGL